MDGFEIMSWVQFPKGAPAVSGFVAAEWDLFLSTY